MRTGPTRSPWPPGTRRRRLTASRLLVVAIAVCLLSGTAVAQAALTDDRRLTVTFPGRDQRVSGPDITLTGTVGSAAGSSLAVQFVVDVSGSTTSPSWMDCDGDGTSQGDDFNGDRRVGDVLDCEISAVAALAADLRTLPDAGERVRVGLTAFGTSARVATVDPEPSNADKDKTRAVPESRFWVAPGATGDGTDVIPRIATVASSLTAGRIGRYEHDDLGTGTDFDVAVRTALSAFHEPRVSGADHVMLLLTDGAASVSAATLDTLRLSGVRTRTYAVGAGSSACAPGAALARIAEAGGDTCTAVADPAALRATLTAGGSSNLRSLTVDVGGIPADVTVDALGNWSARVVGVPDGPATASATATYTDGATSTEVVRFTVHDDFEYVAMGDSYASGEGVLPYIGRSAGSGSSSFLCHRSERGWPRLVHRPGHPSSISAESEAAPMATTFRFVACSGARMVNLDTTMQEKKPSAGRDTEIPLQRDSLSSTTDLVTLSIGGNDIGFAPIVQHCMSQLRCLDDGFVDDAAGQEVVLRDWATIRLALVGSELGATYRTISSRIAVDGQVVALTYPRLVSENWFGAAVGSTCFVLSTAERSWIRTQADTFAAVVHRQARAHGVQVADVRDAFEGHLVCDMDNYVYPVEASRPSDLDQSSAISAASFHPTDRGAQEYAAVVDDVLHRTQAVSAARLSPLAPPAGDVDVDPEIVEAPEQVLARFSAATVRAVATTTFSAVALGRTSAADDVCDEVVPHERVPLLADGFAPGSEVQIRLSVDERPVGTASATADADGRVLTDIELPAVDDTAVVGFSVRGTNDDEGPVVGFAVAEASTDPACTAALLPAHPDDALAHDEDTTTPSGSASDQAAPTGPTTARGGLPADPGEVPASDDDLTTSPYDAGGRAAPVDPTATDPTPEGAAESAGSTASPGSAPTPAAHPPTAERVGAPTRTGGPPWWGAALLVAAVAAVLIGAGRSRRES